MPSVSFDLSNGLYPDADPLYVPAGFASTGNHVRFIDGSCRKIGGAQVIGSGGHSKDFVRGMFPFVHPLSGTQYTFFGCRDVLYRMTGSSAVQVGSGYSGTASTPWTFAAYGQIVLASNGLDPIQVNAAYPYSTFSNMVKSGTTDPPTGRVIRLYQNHLMVTGDVTDGTGYNPYRVWNSDLEDIYNWDDVAGSEAGYFDLRESRTPIVGAETLGDLFVVYTEDQIHVMQYTSGTFVFLRRVVDWNTGLLAQRLVTTVEGAHVFMGQDNFHLFDGTQVIPIGDGINRTVFDRLNLNAISKAFAFTVRETGEAWFCLPVDASDEPNFLAIFNTKTRSWGLSEIQAPPEYLIPPPPALAPINTISAGTEGTRKEGARVALARSLVFSIASLDVGDTWGNDLIEGYVDTPEFGGENGETIQLRTIYPHVECEGEVGIRIGHRHSRSEDISWYPPLSPAVVTDEPPMHYDPRSQDKMDVLGYDANGTKIPANDRYFRIRISGVDKPFVATKITVDYQPTGRR